MQTSAYSERRFARRYLCVADDGNTVVKLVDVISLCDHDLLSKQRKAKGLAFR